MINSKSRNKKKMNGTGLRTPLYIQDTHQAKQKVLQATLAKIPKQAGKNYNFLIILQDKH